MKPYVTKGMTIAVVFFIIGYFSTFIEGFLPTFQAQYHLGYWKLGFFDSVFFLMYLLAPLINKWCGLMSNKARLILGCVLLILGTLGWMFWIMHPAQTIWPLMSMTALIALGVVMLFIICQPLALFLNGSAKPARLSLFQACHGLGCFIAPLMVTANLSWGHILSDFKGGSLVMMISVVMLVWTVLQLSCHSPAFDLPKMNIQTSSDPLPRLAWIYALALFIYFGIEMTTATYVVSHGLTQHIPKILTRWSLTLYWFLMILGRVIGAFLVSKVSPEKLLRASCLCGLILMSVALSCSNIYGFSLMILSGWANAMIFPLIFSLALMTYPWMKTRISALLSCALCGGAIMPLLVGIIADYTHLTHALFCVPIGYALILGLLVLRHRPCQS